MENDSEDDISSDNNEAVGVNRPPRKPLTRNRAVNSIDTELNLGHIMPQTGSPTQKSRDR